MYWFLLVLNEIYPVFKRKTNGSPVNVIEILDIRVFLLNMFIVIISYASYLP